MVSLSQVIFKPEEVTKLKTMGLEPGEILVEVASTQELCKG